MEEVWKGEFKQRPKGAVHGFSKPPHVVHVGIRRLLTQPMAIQGGKMSEYVSRESFVNDNCSLAQGSNWAS